MGKRNKVTTRDLAEYTGLSQSTVSMVLSQKSGVSFSPDTIAKVEEAAKALGYKKPKPGTKKKEKNLAQSIIVVCPTLSNNYYSMLTQSITHQAQAYNYTVLTIATLRDIVQEENYLKLLQGFELSGIIFLSPPENTSIVNSIARQIPVVLVGDKPANCRYDCVELSSNRPGYMIGEHLTSLGHTHLAFLSSPIRENDIHRIYRLNGLKQCLENQGIPSEQIHLMTPTKSEYQSFTVDNREFESGYFLAKKTIQRYPEVTAFIGNNDMISYGIMAAISEMGYRIPQDYSVCGFDNLPMSSMPQISLTTIEHAARRKGKEAVDIIYRKNQQANDPATQSYTMRMEYEPQLIIRKTTGRVRA